MYIFNFIKILEHHKNLYLESLNRKKRIVYKEKCGIIINDEKDRIFVTASRLFIK